MSKKYGVDLDEMKKQFIQKLYQVETEEGLRRIREKLEPLNAILDKYDKRFSQMIDAICELIIKDPKKYITHITNDIYDNIKKYTPEELIQVQFAIQDCIRIAGEEICQKAKREEEELLKKNDELFKIFKFGK